MWQVTCPYLNLADFLRGFNHDKNKQKKQNHLNQNKLVVCLLHPHC